MVDNINIIKYFKIKLLNTKINVFPFDFIEFSQVEHQKKIDIYFAIAFQILNREIKSK